MKTGHVAIMQPYIFPYIGYFHLIDASRVFVFYDDVHFIKGGWINRNRILSQDKDYLFTVPVAKASQNKLINEIAPAVDAKWKDRFYQQLTHSYKKAPFFPAVFEEVTSIFDGQYTDVADLAIESILSVYRYLGLKFEYTKSSICSPGTRGAEKADRLIEITRELGYEAYVNSPGGKELYSVDYFLGKQVALSFIKSNPVKYRQYSADFVPGLSIIDILMFNEKERIAELFSAYTLE